MKSSMHYIIYKIINIFRNEILFFFVFILGTLFAFLIISLIPNEPFSDFQQYYDIAIRFTKFDDFYITYKSIGYPILLGCWFLIFNSTSIYTAKLFNLFCYMLLLIFALLFCKQRNFSKTSKVTFISLLAFCPLALFYTNTLGCELISILLVMIITLLYTNNGNSILKWIALGGTIALLSLVKSFFIFFPFLILFIELIIKKIKLYKPIILLITFFLILSPFAYKATKLTGSIAFIPSNGGIVLYRNNNSTNMNGIVQSFNEIVPPEGIVKEMENAGLHYADEYKSAQKFYSKYGSIWILNHFDKFLQLGFIRIKKVLFDPEKLHYPLIMSYQNIVEKNQEMLFFNWFTNTADAIMNIYSGCLAIFLVIGIIMITKSFFKRKPLDRMIYLVLFSSFFQMAVFFIAEGQSRYFITLVINAVYSILFVFNAVINNFNLFIEKE
jgi:hypothetical protein